MAKLNIKNFAVRKIILVMSIFISVLSNAKTAPPNCFDTSAINDSEISITKYLCLESDVVFPQSIDGKKIVEIGDNAFERVALRSVSIPEGVVRIGKFSFSDTGLNEVSLPKTLKIIDDLAFWNNRISSISLPDGIEKLGYGAFQINALRKVVLPNSITEIGQYAFERNLLGGVTLPESLEKIPLGAFNENRISSVTFPNRVKVIEDLAFANNALEKVVLPSSLTEIGRFAFKQNYLTSVSIHQGVKNIGTEAFTKNRIQKVEIPGTTFLDRSFSQEVAVTRVGPSYDGYWARYRSRVEMTGIPIIEHEYLREVILSDNKQEYLIKEITFNKDGTSREKIENNIEYFASPEWGRTQVDKCLKSGGQFVERIINGISFDTCRAGGDMYAYAPVPFGFYLSSVSVNGDYNRTDLLIDYGRNTKIK